MDKYYISLLIDLRRIKENLIKIKKEYFKLKEENRKLKVAGKLYRDDNKKLRLELASLKDKYLKND